MLWSMLRIGELIMTVNGAEYSVLPGSVDIYLAIIVLPHMVYVYCQVQWDT